jgi:hypothetical protein
VGEKGQVIIMPMVLNLFESVDAKAVDLKTVDS